MGFFDKAKSFLGHPALGPVLEIGADYMGLKAGEDEAQRTREHADEMRAADIAMQKEFAQMGIRWRVEDAKAAGLHPLAALGSGGSSYTPSGVSVMADRSREDFYHRTGQNLSRALSATATSEERSAKRLQLVGMDLDNQIKRAELAKLQNSPPFPSVIEKPLERVAAESDMKWQEVGNYPSVAYMKSPTGLVPIMPPNLAEALESDELNQKQWLIRYKGGPNVAPIERPSKNKLPSGSVGWIWDFSKQEWRPMSRRGLENRGRELAERRYRAVPRLRWPAAKMRNFPEFVR